MSAPTEAVVYEKAPRKDFHNKQFKNPKEIAEALRDAAIKKAHVHPLRIIVLGILAGFFVGFGGMFATASAGGLEIEFAHHYPGVQKLIVGATFPVALALILLCGGELYTGNTMTMTIGLLTRKVTVGQALKVLILSYITNLLGCHLIAGLIVTVGGFFRTAQYQDFLHYLIVGKLEGPDWGQLLIRSIPANMLVCLAVMIAIGAEDIGGKMVGMWMPIMTFATAGMEHCIANMYFLPSAIWTGAGGDYGTFIWKNLIPVTIGNTIGGAFIGFCYWFIYIIEDKPVTAVHRPHWMHLPHWHWGAHNAARNPTAVVLEPVSAKGRSDPKAGLLQGDADSDHVKLNLGAVDLDDKQSRKKRRNNAASK